MKIRLDGKEYQLTDSVKLERVKSQLGTAATTHDLVIEYDKIGGRITDSDGNELSPHTFWNKDKEAYAAEFEDLAQRKDKALDTTANFALQNVAQLRAFNSTLLTIDIALIGAVFTLLAAEKTSVIHSFFFLNLGLTGLFIDAVYIVFLTDAVLIVENKNIFRKHKFLNSTFDASIKFLTDTLARGASYMQYKEESFEKMKEFAEQEGKLDEANPFSGVNFLRLANYIFMFGFTLVMMAFVPWALIWQII